MLLSELCLLYSGARAQTHAHAALSAVHSKPMMTLIIVQMFAPLSHLNTTTGKLSNNPYY